MQEIRRENGLLLQLVKSLEGEINSKNRENQLLFSQYEQLANQNKQLANQNSSLAQENQLLKRSQPPKESYKYSYAILNSPRTQKLQAQVNDLTQLLARQRNQTQQILLQLQKITKQKEELNKTVHELEKNNQEDFIRKSNQRIDYLQKDLWRKQKEMKELTLIMYAKDATASEIAFKQEQKNRQIDILKKEIERLKVEKERDYKINEQKRNTQQKKRIERIQRLQIMLEQANKKSIQERKSHKEQLQRIILKQQTQSNYQNQFNKLQSIFNKQRNANKQKILTLQIQISKKQKQIQQGCELLKIKSEKLQQLSYFCDIQGYKLQQALKTIQTLKQNIKIKSSSLLISSIQSINIPNQQTQSPNLQQHLNQLKQQQLQFIQIKREMQNYNIQLNSASLRLVQIEQFSNHYKEEIAQSERIKSILVSQIQRSDCRIQDMKSEIVLLSKTKQQISQKLEQKSVELYTLDESIQQKRSQNERLRMQNRCMVEQKDILGEQLRKLEQLIEQRTSHLSNVEQNTLKNQYVTAQTQFQQNQSLQNQLQQFQQSTNSFMQILQNLQQELRNKQTIKEELHSKYSISLQSLSQLQRQKQQLSKLLQKYIEQSNQNKDRISNLQAQIIDISINTTKPKQQSNQTPFRKQMNGKQQIQVLNAVIEQIKSQHQSSISKIQSKNILIQELDESLQSLRQEIRRKDAIIQQLSLFKSNAEQQKSKIGLMSISLIQPANDKNQQICDINHRPISSIISPANSQQHHYNQHYQDSPSQIQIQNEQLHQTVQQQNYIITSLQNQLIVLENHKNSQIIHLQKIIACTNAQIIALKRSIAESNPKLHELDRLARDFCVRPEASRLSSKNGIRNRMNSPHPIDLTYQDDQKADLSQSITKLSKTSRISANLNTSNFIPKRSSPSFEQLVQSRINSSNPYIKQMTDQRGNLKFPSNGNWSIEQLRSILQANHN